VEGKGIYKAKVQKNLERSSRGGKNVPLNLGFSKTARKVQTCFFRNAPEGIWKGENSVSIAKRRCKAEIRGGGGITTGGRIRMERKDRRYSKKETQDLETQEKRSGAAKNQKAGFGK